MTSNPQGMGPDAHGPDFSPPTFGRPPGPGDPVGDQQPTHRPTSSYGRVEPPRPPRDRRPTIITIAVIGVVAVIVVVATIVANQRELPGAGSATATPTPSIPAAVPSSSDDSITFSSREGSGQLTLVSHEWTESGAIEPQHGAYLQLTVEISATDGSVSYGPEYFQSFDSTGDLFQTTEAGVTDPILGSGVLTAGESVTGQIAFDLPRGPVTLLMSNALLESVTALRITD